MSLTRRGLVGFFMGAAFTSAMGVLRPLFSSMPSVIQNGDNSMGFSLPLLPYGENDLAPYISAETLSYHYGKHHATYVNNLNSLIKGTDYESLNLEQIISKSASDNSKTSIFNNAAQVWNHTFYWQSMKKSGGGSPAESSAILKKINSDLGGMEKFTATFSEYGASQFGSGWVWLVLENGKLKITKTSNADLPIIHNQIPLLTMDVWEHAYYIDFRNLRAKYIADFLGYLINWDFAEQNLLRAI